MYKNVDSQQGPSSTSLPRDTSRSRHPFALPPQSKSQSHSSQLSSSPQFREPLKRPRPLLTPPPSRFDDRETKLSRLTPLKPLPPPDDEKAKLKPAHDGIGRLEAEMDRNHNLSESVKQNFERLRKKQEDFEKLVKHRTALELKLEKAVDGKQTLESRVEERTAELEMSEARLQRMIGEKESLKVAEQEMMAELRSHERMLMEATGKLERMTRENLRLVELLKERDHQPAEFDGQHEEAEARHNRIIEAKNGLILDWETRYEQVVKEGDEARETRDTTFLDLEKQYKLVV